MTTLTWSANEPNVVAQKVAIGVLVSVAAIGHINYQDYKKEQMSKEEAIKNGLKVVVQGGIATTTTIAIGHMVERKSWMGVLGALSLGVAGIYGVEKFYRTTTKELKSTEENHLIEEN